jgi:hypothetical protein
MGFKLLSSVTVGSGGASSIDFTSIPNNYRDICLFITLRNGGIEAADFRLNGDTTSSYTWYYVQSTGTSMTRGAATGTSVAEAMVTNGTSTSNTFSSSVLYFPNYTSGVHKVFSLETAEEESATTAYMRLAGGRWANTSAITSISIFGATNFVQHSSAYLYGIL